MPEPIERKRQMGLPLKVFLYTLDQIATMVEVDIKTLKSNYVYYSDRSIGARQHPLLEARNIAPEGQKPEWRVAENEFVRWLRYKGFKVYRGVY